MALCDYMDRTPIKLSKLLAFLSGGFVVVGSGSVILLFFTLTFVILRIVSDLAGTGAFFSRLVEGFVGWLF